MPADALIVAGARAKLLIARWAKVRRLADEKALRRPPRIEGPATRRNDIPAAVARRRYVLAPREEKRGERDERVPLHAGGLALSSHRTVISTRRLRGS